MPAMPALTDVRRLLAAVLVACTVVVVLLVVDPAGQSQGPEPIDAAPAAPETFSTDDFCAAFEALDTAHATAVETTSVETIVALKDTAASTLDLATRTTPALEQSALEGLQFIVSVLQTIPDTADTQRVLSMGRTPSVTEEARAQAFSDFLDAQCLNPAPTQ